MKIIGTFFLVISVVDMASGQSAFFQKDTFDSINYNLHDVLKLMCTSLPRMENMNFLSPYFGELKMTLQPICDYILKEPDAPGGFNATDFCHFCVDFFQLRTLMQSPVEVGGPESLWNDFSVRLYGNISKKLYGIDIKDPTTICPNAHRYFQHSVRDLLRNQQIEYLTELLDNFNHEIDSICRDLKGYFASLGVPHSSPLLQLLGNILDLSTDILGFENFGNLCQMMRSREYFSGDLSLRRKATKSAVRALLADDHEHDEKPSRRWTSRTSSNNGGPLSDEF